MRWARKLEWWIPCAVGFSPLILWFIPTSTYEVSATRERAVFALGWPDRWYESETTFEAGRVMQSDGVLRTRPFTPLGPRAIGSATSKDVEKFKPERGDIGRDGPTLRRRGWFKPWYGPLWPTAIGIGVLYVTTRVNREGPTGVRKRHDAGPPNPPV